MMLKHKFSEFTSRHPSLVVVAFIFSVCLSIYISWVGLSILNSKLTDNAANKTVTDEDWKNIQKQIEQFAKTHPEHKPATLQVRQHTFTGGLAYRFVLEVNERHSIYDLYYDLYFTMFGVYSNPRTNVLGVSPEELKSSLSGAYWIYPLPDAITKLASDLGVAGRGLAALCLPKEPTPRCAVLEGNDFPVGDGFPRIVDVIE